VEALANTQSRPARVVFDSAFREYGLPEAIRTDGGVPFYNLGPASLTLLSVWWIKLGIVPERIAPGRPQQNGRHERMHRTLKAHAARPPQADPQSQQRCLDQFRDFFNLTRPHESLGQRPPAHLYAPSLRRYDGRVPATTYPGHCECRRVKSRGDITWRGRRLFISEALIGELLGLEEVDDGVWRVFFGPLLLGHILDAELHHGLIHVNSKLSRLVSPMSPD
jgi:putative transposase